MEWLDDPDGPHLPQGEADPVLHALPEDTAKFWTDQAHRVKMLRHLNDTLRSTSDPRRINPLINQIDRHVVAGLRALGFDRGPINGVFVVPDEVYHHVQVFSAAKLPSCSIRISIQGINRKIERGAEDEIFLDFIHESMHSRARYASDYTVEDPWIGYEEAAAETMSRSLARRAGLMPRGDQYAHWTRSLASLADALGVAPDHLAQEMMAAPPGAVRRGFLKAVERARGSSLSTAQAERLGQAADEVFSNQGNDRRVIELGDEPDPAAVAAAKVEAGDAAAEAGKIKAAKIAERWKEALK